MAGTIKFTTERMNEVHNRIGEIIEQLQTTLSADSDCLNQIASNIQSEAMAGTLKSYAESNIEKGKNTVTVLQKMDEFLMAQMTEYNETDAEAQDTISEVQGILNQIQ